MNDAISRENSVPCASCRPKCASEARVVAPRLLAADNLDEFFEAVPAESTRNQ